MSWAHPPWTPERQEEERIRVQRIRHGLIASEKAQIASDQGGCAICRTLDPGRAGWVVDHDRACCPREKSCPKCRRGILCQPCNMILGLAHDDTVRLRAAANYVEAPPGVPMPGAMPGAMPVTS